MISPAQITFTDQAWQSDPARWRNARQYHVSCLLDDQLPIREPDGRYNVLAMQMAAHALPSLAGATDAKRTAARQLIHLLRLAKRPAPQSLLELADSAVSMRATTPDLTALAERVVAVQAQAARIRRRDGGEG